MFDYSTRLGYLQRIAPGGAPLPQIGSHPAASLGLPTQPVEFNVSAVGRLIGETETPSAALPRRSHSSHERFVSSMAGKGQGFACTHSGWLNAGRYRLGTWSEPSEASSMAAGVAAACMKASFQSVIFSEAPPSNPGFTHGGFAIGIPALADVDYRFEFSAIDQLHASLGRGDWSITIVAEPFGLAAGENWRAQVMAEQEAVSAESGGQYGATPIATAYLDGLKLFIDHINQGLRTGLWRTAVYLMGDPDTYFHARAVLTGLFASEDTALIPLRVYDDPSVATLGSRWALPSMPCERGTGRLSHPFAYQTILTSPQLASLCEAPRRELPGFRLYDVPSFDQMPALAAGPRIRLGRVVVAPETASVETDGLPIEVSLDDLTRHVLVAGTTGSGKSTSIFGMLAKIADPQLEGNVPFLVIEPTKSEYRHLAIRSQALPALYSPGGPDGLPLHLNPFEVIDHKKTPIGVHLDLLKSLFSSSFGMWSPLPQILERSLQEIYEDFGWNIAANCNSLLAGGAPPDSAFPTISDLVDKAEEVIASLGYNREITDNMRSALVTRLNGLRYGSKGALLDVQSSTPIGDLLSEPAVIELQNIGDDDDKAFIMGLVFIRLAEYLRSLGPTEHLRHLVVIEEAHRLLGAVSKSGGPEEGNPKAKAVEMFSSLLAEVRAYGEGVMIADQSPVSLAPVVMKNTNLKIGLRLVERDDQEAMAGALGLDRNRAGLFSALMVRCALVHGSHEDRPLLVQIDPPAERASEDLAAAVRAPASAAVSRSRIWPIADGVGSREAFARYVTALADPNLDAQSGLESLQTIPASVLRANENARSFWQAFLERLVSTHSRRCGRALGWMLDEIADYERALAEAIDEHYDGRTDDKVVAFRNAHRNLHLRSFDPYPACTDVCGRDGEKGPCRYRWLGANLASAQPPESRAAWLTIAEEGGEPNDNLMNRALAATERLFSRADQKGSAHIRLSLCFGQQVLSSLPDWEAQAIVAPLAKRALQGDTPR